MRQKGLLLPKRSEDEKFSKLKSDFTKLSPRDLSKHHQKLTAWEGYLGTDIALLDIEIADIKKGTTFLLASAQYNNKIGRQKAEVLLIATSAEYRSLVDCLVKAEAKKCLLEAMQKDVARRAAAASRDLTRREFESGHGRLGRST